jgi:hypothetical protein
LSSGIGKPPDLPHPLAFLRGKEKFAGGYLKLTQAGHVPVYCSARLHEFSARLIRPPPRDRGREQKGEETSQRKGREGKPKQE